MIEHSLPNPCLSSLEDQKRYIHGMELLISAIQELSLARDLETITKIVRTAARKLTHSDGATFVLKDGDFCYYVDEDAISPLWKGKRFTQSICITEYCIRNRSPIIIPDVEGDERIPIEAYRPTFIKSLLMIPIRTQEPIGAIGNYWAEYHEPTLEEIKLVQALADSTFVALENIQVHTELEQRVHDRTSELQAVNQELERSNQDLEQFASIASHDLNEPLRMVTSFTQLLKQKYSERLDSEANQIIDFAVDGATRMKVLINDLLAYSRVNSSEKKFKLVSTETVLNSSLSNLRLIIQESKAEIIQGTLPKIFGDQTQLFQLFQNIIANGIQYRQEKPIKIYIGAEVQAEQWLFSIKDNGIGIDPQYCDSIFQIFQRLHTKEEYPGTGIGLAVCQKIVERHGGKIWVESELGQGATFYFTIPICV